MRTSFLSIALTCLAGPSLALSCIAPDVSATFTEAAASETGYIVVHGTLTFDESHLPEVDFANQEQTPPMTDIAAHLSGKSLSDAGFQSEFDRPITLRALCYGPWCGLAKSGGDYLSFLEATDEGYMLTVTPCGGYEFPDPSDEMLSRVAQCFKAGKCAP